MTGSDIPSSTKVRGNNGIGMFGTCATTALIGVKWTGAGRKKSIFPWFFFRPHDGNLWPMCMPARHILQSHAASWLVSMSVIPWFLIARPTPFSASPPNHPDVSDWCPCACSLSSSGQFPPCCSRCSDIHVAWPACSPMGFAPHSKGYLRMLWHLMAHICSINLKSSHHSDPFMEPNECALFSISTIPVNESTRWGRASEETTQALNPHLHGQCMAQNHTKT